MVFLCIFCRFLRISDFNTFNANHFFVIWQKKFFIPTDFGSFNWHIFSIIIWNSFFEQVAFLFFFLSLALLLEGIKQVKYSFVFLAGFLSLVCLLSKQNVGILCIPALCFLLCLHIPFNFSIICRRLFSCSCSCSCYVYCLSCY